MFARDGNVQAIPTSFDVAALVREYGISLNSDDTVAFAVRSLAPAGSAIYRSNRGATPEPVLLRPVLDLWAVTINDGGAIAFVEQSLSTQLPVIGLISALRVLPRNSSTPVKVIQTGDALFGSTVAGLQILERASAFKYMNNSGVVAFHYVLANGMTGIAFASPQ
jgi:hypothetical protein